MKTARRPYTLLLPYLYCLGLVVVTTLFGEVIKRIFEPTNIIMFYLLVVVFASIRWGKGPGVSTSILSVLAFDFFLVRPYLTLSVEDIQYLFTFTAFIIVALVVSSYASRVREHVIQSQTDKLYSALLSSISHDLKTPLVAITGALTTLLDHTSKLNTTHTRDLLRTACGESGRMNRIVNNLLDMTRMEAGVLKLTLKPCDVRDLIGMCLEQLKEKTTGRTIKIDIAKDIPESLVDVPYMVKAISNIIDNALKYSPAKKPVHIVVRPRGKTIRMTISDQGCGIPRKDRERIFDKFYRVESSQHISGTGLGLCISKNIIEAHDGNLRVSSVPGKRTTFTISLPATGLRS